MIASHHGVSPARQTRDGRNYVFTQPRTNANIGQDLRPQTVQIYVGPKSQPLLTEVEPSLGKHLIDLGFFSVLARPMLQLLILVNNVVRNYGITIILVTIVIKIIFFPLTHKSYKSMQGMQKLQPKMKELQARYKDDRQGLNQAMMQLYRGEKVNPMGGCLPMLLQIPVFFAFYNALLYSIELRHAPFICWETSLFWVGRGICDLSVYDPTYITPVHPCEHFASAAVLQRRAASDPTSDQGLRGSESSERTLGHRQPKLRLGRGKRGPVRMPANGIGIPLGN